MTLDEAEWAVRRALTQMSDERLMLNAMFGACGVTAFALVTALPNHVFVALVLTLLGLCGWWLYSRVLRNFALYRRIYQTMQAHYRGEETGNLLHQDDTAPAISAAEQREFEQLVRVFKDS